VNSLSFLLLLWSVNAYGAAPMPLFDAHMHYCQDARAALSPHVAANINDRYAEPLLAR
jgi:hypothetical protein